MEHPLYIAFVWHMHQPYYKDPLSGEISLPWVRLHGIKDYLNMVDIVKDFPAIHQTFNLVPSLIDQIEDYTRGKLPDEKFLTIALKPAADLTLEEKKFILLNFFMANWENMIMPLPRFYELLLKRGRFVSPALLDRIAPNFKTQDYLDLQVLFNLSWFDPAFINNNPSLSALTRKGAKFTEEDKTIVIQRQIDILKKIIPAYKALQDKSQIEVSVSPYYHPILPLLCDSTVAKIGMPNEKFPQKRFSHREDAQWQVENAVKRYEDIFKKKPAGMWPSEGSVSEDILPILIKNGIKWIATDEEILLRSINKPRTAEVLYRPYLLKRGDEAINIIFRDHNFSDAIGFIYQGAPPQKAVNDFIGHLHRIREALAAKGENFLVPVILDGENAWEYYSKNGRDFLSLLYLRLSEEGDRLRTTTVSEFLKNNPPRVEISNLYPGSWISSNFSIWIGEEEKNTSWDYLSETRDELTRFQETHPKETNSEKMRMAWKEIYIAEGSDWNWWYGPQNSSSCDEEFDRLYRKHLTNVYTLIGQPAPDHLKIPIITKAAKPLRRARGLISPVIDGLDTTYYEWLEAACFEVGTSGGTMHRAQSIIQTICCGFDLKSLFIKVALNLSEILKTKKEGIALICSKTSPPEVRIEIPVFDDISKLKAFLYCRDNHGNWKLIKEISNIAYKKVLEMSVKFSDLKVQKGEEFNLTFFIEENGLTLERQPESGPIRLVCPTADYEAYNWTV